MKKIFKQTGVSGFWGEELRPEKISMQGDPLERLNAVIDRSVFNTTLEKILPTKRKSNAGAKPFSPLLMFKILVLQRYCNLSDFQLEYQIPDRLSFSRFPGLTLNDNVPDEKTVWAFRERLTDSNSDIELFEVFHNLPEKAGLTAHEGKTVDASFAEVLNKGIRKMRMRISGKTQQLPKIGQPTKKDKKIQMPVGRKKQAKLLRL